MDAWPNNFYKLLYNFKTPNQARTKDKSRLKAPLLFQLFGDSQRPKTVDMKRAPPNDAESEHDLRNCTAS